MDVTILGTGTPMPSPQRAGTAVHLDISDEQILIDCGPGSVQKLLEEDIDISQIDKLFFTHQHIDHNSDFFYFLISSWSLGRDNLTIYGPEGTEEFIDAFHSLYEKDLEYRQRLDYPDTGIEEFEFRKTTPELSVEEESWTVTALPVNHSIETYGYRFEEEDSGNVFVFSGDTTMIPEISSFASDADLLLQDACVSPLRDEPPESTLLWDHMHDPSLEERFDNLRKTHCTAKQAGQIASDADVDRLVLTHLLPHCDVEATYADAALEFDGEIVVAEDGISFTL